ncbi:FAD binding domain-containing protein [Syncephalis plumigaleata]|nr:FAD binding domain-containing protein [Syncephalis plumigaleata]
METDTKYPVIVIGAGPSGLLASIVLAEAGVPVEIYECKLEPMNELRSAGIQPRSLEILSAYGLVDRYIKAGTPFVHTTVYRDGRFRPLVSIDCMRTEFPFILACGQSSNEGILTKRLLELGIQIKRGWRYIAHETTEGNSHVTVQLQRVDSEEIIQRRAFYVVGCDGGHSSIRKAIGAQFNGITLGFKLLVCDIEMDIENFPTTTAAASPEGFIGCVRAVRNGRYRAFMGWNSALPDMNEAEFLETIKRQFHPLDLKVKRLLSFSTFNVNERRASKYQSDDKRVFICGDAAHTHSPAGGQGMNTGLQDAENLAWKIGMVYNGYAKPDILGSYMTERAPIADDIIRFSANLTNLTRQPWIFRIYVYVLHVFHYLPKLWIRPFVERAAQLRFKYESSEYGGIFPDTPAWTKASTSLLSALLSWLPFQSSSSSSTSLCTPGTRAINCEVIDTSNTITTRIGKFFLANRKSYTAIVFVDCRLLDIDETMSASSSATQLPTSFIEQLDDLSESLQAYRSRVPLAFVLHGIAMRPKTEDLQETVQAIASQLRTRFTSPVYVDIKQEKRFSGDTMADIYKCTSLNEHAVYLVRPDTYVSARMLLSEASNTVRAHFDSMGMIKSSE